MKALVTGAAGGIGRCVVAALEARGWEVLGYDVADLDVRSPEDWARVPPVDLLVNVAGYLRPGAVTDLRPEDVAAHFDVNVRGVVLGLRAVAPAMVAAGRGHVVNVSSLAGLGPVPGLSLYSASKCAVRSFSLAAAAELRPHGVAVTVVCPDAVQTPMLDLQRGFPEAALTFSGPRTLAAEEVAAAIAGPVLDRRPLEHWMPAWRGWMCRLADLFPGPAMRLEPLLRSRGLRRQRR